MKQGTQSQQQQSRPVPARAAADNETKDSINP